MSAFIAGDWGTTHLRLVLADGMGKALATARGPGVAHVQARFDAVLTDLTAAWTRQYGSLPIFLCGMVGSTIGWINAPYVPCPAPPEQIARAMSRVPDHDVLIAPGLSCVNRYGAPDVMRGEETQILGALQLEPALQRGRHLLCLPGTHTKWVTLVDGVVQEFLTSVTGELFALVNDHSVLVRSGTTTDRRAGAAFDTAVRRIQQYPQASLAHLLFECRSRQVMDELTRLDAPDFLSGLLIGHDVASAAQLFAGFLEPHRPPTIVGAAQLTQLYTRAFATLGISTATVDGAEASLAGLTLLHTLRACAGNSNAA